MKYKIGIGIDTGGTYTDAVMYDFEHKEILGGAKALTTPYDLSVGILEALDGLPARVREAGFIALSTTLATNACVEDKGGRAKLIYWGGDAKAIEESGGKYGLPPAGEIYIQESYTNFSGESEREPDWALFKQSLPSFTAFDGVGIVEMNAMKNGAATEKKAKAILQAEHDIPVVCGHELFSALNSLQRAAGTLLNARLFPVIADFLKAMKAATNQRGIIADIVIIRSDGGMMSESFASERPVETLLCGPAASVIGSAYLSGEPDCVVVDMGGTTTDIALVKDHTPVMAAGGVSVGKWKTFVDGLYIKTVGLGGDSAVHYTDGSLRLEEYRVVPICVAAARYPVIARNIQALPLNGGKHTKFLYEHYMLIRDINAYARYTDEEKAVCRALADGPLSVKDAPLVIGKDMYNFDISRLIKEGVVQVCGLTPTDIMHIRGDFTRYPVEASLWAARYVAANLDITVDVLCDQVYDAVKRRLYHAVVNVLLENNSERYMRNGINRDVERFIDENYEAARSGGENGILSMSFKSRLPLVGIGAPITVFLHDVAAMLGTTAVITKHYKVANALGAVVGSACASYTVEVRPNYSVEGIVGYTVFGQDENRVFDDREEAEAFAAEEAKRVARAEALRRGAYEPLTVTCRLSVNEAPARDCAVYLGTSAIARASVK